MIGLVRLGGYEDSFWPFGLDARSEDVNRGVVRRLRGRAVSWSGTSNLKKEVDEWVWYVSPYMRDDSPAAVAELHRVMADAVAPVRVEIGTVTLLRTVRYREEPDSGPPLRPGREGLRTTGWSHLALLQGILRRPVEGETCDVVIESSSGLRTSVHLSFEHRTAPSGITVSA